MLGHRESLVAPSFCAPRGAELKRERRHPAPASREHFLSKLLSWLPPGSLAPRPAPPAEAPPLPSPAEVGKPAGVRGTATRNRPDTSRSLRFVETGLRLGQTILLVPARQACLRAAPSAFCFLLGEAFAGIPRFNLVTRIFKFSVFADASCCFLVTETCVNTSHVSVVCPSVLVVLFAVVCQSPITGCP